LLEREDSRMTLFGRCSSIVESLFQTKSIPVFRWAELFRSRRAGRFDPHDALAHLDLVADFCREPAHNARMRG